MRRLMLILTLWIVLFVPVSVQAQGKMHLSLVSVDIWPEYDQPAVLMIYHITLAPDTVLPASLTVQIPSGVQINAVAVVDPVKGLINAAYDDTVLGRWSALKITTNSLQVQIEYYAALVKNVSTRHIVFEWAGDYPVDKLEVKFLRPLGAESVSISLAPVDTSPGQDGLTNYRMEAANLAADQPFKLTIDYQRQTDALSISSLPVQAVSTPGPDTPGHVSMTGVLPWVLAGIGILLIAAGIVGFIVWQRGGQGSATGRRYTPHRKESENEFTYCHQCGKRAQAGDVFCRTCGTRLKRGSTD
jgi:hypothetical protein